MKTNRYSIKDLENLTNIKAHTIRIWEQRYSLLHPKRTDTNIRYYEDQDLKKLLNINLLYSNGFKISKIAGLSEEEIISQSKNIIHEHAQDVPDTIEVIIMSIIDLDTKKVHDILEQAFDGVAIEDFYGETIVPLLERIGKLWQLNSISVGHEHFFSNILREFLLAKTAELPLPKTPSRKALLFLHAQEEHEISLFIYHYILKREGWNVAYIGARVPDADLQITYNKFQPDLLVSSFITNISSAEFKRIVKVITTIAPPEKCVFSGYVAQMNAKLIPEKVRLIRSREDLKNFFV